MKLLICTQVVDKTHPILGFFHRWIEEFAKHFEEVHVICLQKGEYSFPENVYVYSLGKEEGRGRITYIFRFYTLIWKLRKRYDAVFVHMNQIYVILGGLLWRTLGKQIGFWYMHKSIKDGLWLAEKMAHVIFTASEESFRLPSKKVIVTGHGVNTELFVSKNNSQKNLDLITVGRLSPSKNFEMAIAVLEQVRKVVPVTLTIVGGTNDALGEEYKKDLTKLAEKRGLSDAVIFAGPVAHADLPGLLSQSKVFLHTAKNGSLDKALLEPLALGIPTVSSSEAALAVPLGDWKVETPNEMAKVVIDILQHGPDSRTERLQSFVREKHSILSLIPAIREHLMNAHGV